MLAQRRDSGETGAFEKRIELLQTQSLGLGEASPGDGKRARKKDPEGPDSAVHRVRNGGQNHAADQGPAAPSVGRSRIYACLP